MKYRIINEIPGRLRIGLVGYVPASDIDALNSVVCACSGVIKTTVYPRIGSLAVTYRADEGVRERVLKHLASIDAKAIEAARNDFCLALAPRTGALLMDIAVLIGGFLTRRLLLPPVVGAIMTVWRYRTFLAAARRSRSTPAPVRSMSLSTRFLPRPNRLN